MALSQLWTCCEACNTSSLDMDKEFDDFGRESKGEQSTSLPTLLTSRADGKVKVDKPEAVMRHSDKFLNHRDSAMSMEEVLRAIAQVPVATGKAADNHGDGAAVEDSGTARENDNGAMPAQEATDQELSHNPIPMSTGHETAAQETSTPPAHHPEVKSSSEAGRYAAAHRELLELQKQGAEVTSMLDEQCMMRIDRIGSSFARSMRLLNMRPEELSVFEENKKLKLKWGMKLDGPFMQVVSVADYDVDFLKMVCIDLEPDLEDKTSEDQIKQELFSKPHAHDVCWRKRMVKAGVGTKTDDILVVSSIDALDEPIGAICSLKGTLDRSATVDPFNTPIPAVDAGHNRTPYMMTATAFTPLAIGGDKLRGVRRFECVEVEMAPAVAKVLGMMPNFMLKKLCRGSNESKVNLMTELLKNSSGDLEKRMQSAPRAEFMEHVRTHVLSK